MASNLPGDKYHREGADATSNLSGDKYHREGADTTNNLPGDRKGADTSTWRRDRGVGRGEHTKVRRVYANRRIHGQAPAGTDAQEARVGPQTEGNPSRQWPEASRQIQIPRITRVCNGKDVQGPPEGEGKRRRERTLHRSH